ncbi:MAG: ATP-binding protein [Sphingobium sp.]|nr:ATP-binding protein [Sphingobium sp.]
MSQSLWEELAEWPEEKVSLFLDQIGEVGRETLLHDWSVHARPEQLPPPGDWRIWLIVAGRGFGKTRAGAEWVRSVAENDGHARIALVGATIHEARSVMVEGESGLLSIAPYWDRPVWHPALRRLIWRSGAQAMVFGAGEPDSLRGPQFTHIWADEIAKWAEGDAAWDNLMMGLRLGRHPRVLATTTPRPVSLMLRLMGQANVQGSELEGEQARADAVPAASAVQATPAERAAIVITGGATQDNQAHLSADFIAAMERDYGGTALGRQELLGELIEEPEGALWTRALLERCRLTAKARQEMMEAASPFARIVVAVDPPASSHGDACGIIVAALGHDGRGYVLEDGSVEGARPERWASRVSALAVRHGADRVVAEANNGGEMVGSVLRAAQADIPLKLVHASRGKAARAEPVAALYERGRLAHIAAFPALEDQMCGIMAGGEYVGPGRSPDRADALVWAMTELVLGKAGSFRIRNIW